MLKINKSITDLAFEKFFGFDQSIEAGFNRVILTNIEPLYRALLHNSAIEKSYKGFYESSRTIIKDEAYLIIKITPGNVIIDIIKLLKSNVDYMILVGLAGAINNDAQIGQVICPSIATTADNLNNREFFYNTGLSEGVICQTNGLIQSQHFYTQLQKAKIGFVDMESYYLASLCNIYHIKCRVISIISDNPLTAPFYKVKISFKPDIQKILGYME